MYRYTFQATDLRGVNKYFTVEKDNELEAWIEVIKLINTKYMLNERFNIHGLKRLEKLYGVEKKG